MGTGLVIQGLNIFDVMTIIEKKNKKYIAVFLNELEEILGEDNDKFSLIRKIYLDDHNNYTRSILLEIFGGDVETSSYIK